MHVAANHTPLLVSNAARHKTVLVWFWCVTEPKMRSLDHHQTPGSSQKRKYPKPQSCYSHLHMVPVKPRSSKPLLQQQQLLDPPLFQCIFNITALCCNTAATFSTLQRAGMNLLQHINCSTTPACCFKELLLSLNSPDKNITAEMLLVSVCIRSTSKFSRRRLQV